MDRTTLHNSPIFTPAPTSSAVRMTTSSLSPEDSANMPVIPAKEGISEDYLDSRLRGNDENYPYLSPWGFLRRGISDRAPRGRGEREGATSTLEKSLNE